MRVQEMLSPKAVRVMSHRDKVLMQCSQTKAIQFDEFLSNKYVSVSSFVVDV